MEQQHAYLAFSVCCTVKSSLKFDARRGDRLNLASTAKDFRHSLTVRLDRARMEDHKRLGEAAQVTGGRSGTGWPRQCARGSELYRRGRLSVRLESADVSAHVAAARRLTKKPALDKRFEERPTRLRFQVPQALRLTLGERQTRHLEILASNPFHDRVNRMSLHGVTSFRSS